MNNERAIELLHRLQDEQFDGIHGDERREALEMAVRALEGDGDTISRQAGIDAMCDACSDWCDEGVCKKVSAIQKMPSAQPETHDKRTETHACDLINRQQAIDYCEALMNAERLQQTDDWGYGRERYNQTECIMHYIENMPSAQPEKTCCGYDVTELIGFATACRRAGVDEKDLKNFAQNCEFAWKVMQKETYSAIEEAFEKYSDVSMCQDAEDTEEVIETQVGSLIFRDKVQYGIQEKLKAAYRDGYTAAYEMHCCGGSGARMDGEEND